MLQIAVIPTAQEFKLLEYKFSEFPLDDDNTIKATVRMFLDLDLINKFHITYDVRLPSSRRAFIVSV